METTLTNNQDSLSRLSSEEKRKLFIEGLRKPERFSSREIYLKQEFMVTGLVKGIERATQKVHTPFLLAEEMVRKLTEYIGILQNKRILVYNVEFLDVLYRLGILSNNEVWLVNENPMKVQFAKDIYKEDENDHFIVQNWLNWNTTMKFDVIVGNPPYQAPQDRVDKSSGRSGTTLWDKFVEKSNSLLKTGGYLCYVHPSGWRGFGKTVESARNILSKYHLEYLELHNEKDGLTTFGAETRYDWYVAKNITSKEKSVVKGQDGKEVQVNLTDMPFIPNGMFDEIKSLIAKPGEETVEILHSYSAYESRKPHMSSEKKGKFVYPCVYSIAKDGTPTFFYSNTKENGFFSIPKVIFASGRISSANYIVDEKGEFGLTQFGRGIVDTPENLPKIAAAMRTKKFKQIMEMCAVGFLEINKDVLATFRKDFWKHFVDDKGNELV